MAGKRRVFLLVLTLTMLLIGCSEKPKFRTELIGHRVMAEIGQEELYNVVEEYRKLEKEFKEMVLSPRFYEPEDTVKLFYYVCGKTEIIKQLYYENPTLAGEIVDAHMHWAGEFSMINDFVETWSRAEDESEWDDMIHKKCVKAFGTFKYYPEDLETANIYLPKEVFSEIMVIHEEREVFPDGIEKSDFK